MGLYCVCKCTFMSDATSLGTLLGTAVVISRTCTVCYTPCEVIKVNFQWQLVATVSESLPKTSFPYKVLSWNLHTMPARKSFSPLTSLPSSFSAYLCNHVPVAAIVPFSALHSP